MHIAVEIACIFFLYLSSLNRIILSMTANAQTILVLSGGISQSGRLPHFVRLRLDEAYKQYHAGVAPTITLTGRWSYRLEKNPDITEAASMKAYLVKLGIPEKDILTEEESFDLISAVLFTYKKYIKPRRWKRISLVYSDFHEERVKYVWNKLIPETVHVLHHPVPAHLSSWNLWDFFVYEQHVLVKTKQFLSSLSDPVKAFSEKHILTAPFYVKAVPGYIRHLVVKHQIDPPSKPSPHYSISNIYQSRQQIFTKYGLTVPSSQTLKADYWSGRFLNFAGRDENGTYYALKFVLRPQDKDSFINEMLLADWFNSQNLTFVPVIQDKNMTTAPYWYLYKIVAGRPAGSYTILMAFDPQYLRPFAIQLLIRHLKTFRTLKPPFPTLTTWDSHRYKKSLTRRIKAMDEKRVPWSPSLRDKVVEVFNKHAHVVNSVQKYLSHNDFHPANIIISRAHKRVYFIDFERTGYNTIATDFCHMEIFLLHDSGYRAHVREAFLTSLTPEQREEFHLVYPVIFLYSLTYILSHLHQWRMNVPDEFYSVMKARVIEEIKKTIKSLG